MARWHDARPAVKILLSFWAVKATRAAWRRVAGVVFGEATALASPEVHEPATDCSRQAIPLGWALRDDCDASSRKRTSFGREGILAVGDHMEFGVR
jgi:hypothetical protein